MTVNSELEGIQKEAAVSQYEALFQHFPAQTEESQLLTIYDRWCPSRDSNRAPTEYKSEALIAENFLGRENLWTEIYSWSVSDIVQIHVEVVDFVREQ